MLPSGHFVVKMGVYRAFRDSVAMRIFIFMGHNLLSNP